MDLLNRQFSARSFVPFARTSASSDTNLLRAPKLPCSDTNNLHFGHSLLFTKPNSTTTCLVRIFVTVTFEFFIYDGNQSAVTSSK